ncbi:MAG: trypsin-like peptidase domain-containing protein [candidate division WOR-3 bacterium]
MKITEIIAKAKSSVVRIESSIGNGSGFIIDRRGIILTNYHVIGSDKAATVILSDGRIEIAKIIYSHPQRDIAFLMTDCSNLEPIKLNMYKRATLGEQVIAIGHPIDLPYTATIGIVSFPNRITEYEPKLPFIQFDASIKSGSSGGPLLNLSSEVIGITTAGIATGETFNFAIPLYEIKNYITDIKNRIAWFRNTKYCHICGKANDNINKYCQQCGSILTTSKEIIAIINQLKSEAEEFVICKNCINKISQHQSICYFCGNPIQIGKSRKQRKKTRAKNRLIICPVCQSQNYNNKYCNKCGVKLSTYIGGLR